MLNASKLEAEGWTYRNTASGSRLAEITALYEELGMEVLLVTAAELADPESLGADCTLCLSGDPDPSRHKAIFTRPAQSGENQPLLER